MTKVATTTKKILADPPGQQPSTRHIPSHGGGFFHLMVKASGITRKDLAFILRWSKTYVDQILSGEKNDPLEQSRKFCEELRRLKRADLVAAVAVHVCGGDDFDGRVLTPAQVDALRELVKAVK